MILIDANQLMITSITADNSKMMIDENLIRHVSLNSLRYYRKKYFKEYGELVLVFDSRHSWRKDVFPNYKANRKKSREQSHLNWDEIFRLMNIVKQELRDIFPYKIIEVDRCEGDDVIATLVEWSLKNNIKEGVLTDEPEPILIVSSDEDFLQLHNQHVNQVSIRSKKFLKSDKSREWIVHDHIIRGDSSDGVPNVLSDDNVFVDGRRQKSIYDVKVKEWFDNLPNEESFLKNYERNRLLVDLSCIPIEYKENIINTYLNYETNGREKLLGYFVSKRLRNLMDDLQDF